MPGRAGTRPARVRAVIFDAGNTLIRQDYEAVAARLAQRGYPRDPAQVEAAEERARIALDRSYRPGTSTESHATTLRYLADMLAGLGITEAAEVEDFAKWRRTFDPPLGVWNRPHPAAAEALRLVRAAGLATGVISNSNGSIARVLEAAGLARELSFVVDSAVVGVEKPDARIFRLGLEAAGVAAAEAVYVGDLYTVDVLGARGAGMRAVLIDPRGVWGPRDCPTAPDAAAAVRLVLAEAARPPASI